MANFSTRKTVSELRNESEYAIVQAIVEISRRINGHINLLIAPICLSEELQKRKCNVCKHGEEFECIDHHHCLCQRAFKTCDIHCKCLGHCGNSFVNIPPTNIRQGRLGTELFTMVPIASGRMVLVFGGTVMTLEIYQQGLQSNSKRDFHGGLTVRWRGKDLGYQVPGVGGKPEYVIDPVEDKAGKLIHCCDPNTVFQESWTRGKVYGVAMARRHIDKGEVLTLDYRNICDPTHNVAKICFCKAHSCRGFVATPGSQLMAAAIEHYMKHFTKIRSEDEHNKVALQDLKEKFDTNIGTEKYNYEMDMKKIKEEMENHDLIVGSLRKAIGIQAEHLKEKKMVDGETLKHLEEAWIERVRYKEEVGELGCEIKRVKEELQNCTRVIDLLERRQKVLIEYAIKKNAPPPIEDPEVTRKKMAELKRNKPCCTGCFGCCSKAPSSPPQAATPKPSKLVKAKKEPKAVPKTSSAKCSCARTKLEKKVVQWRIWEEGDPRAPVLPLKVEEKGNCCKREPLANEPDPTPPPKAPFGWNSRKVGCPPPNNALWGDGLLDICEVDFILQWVSGAQRARGVGHSVVAWEGMEKFAYWMHKKVKEMTEEETQGDQWKGLSTMDLWWAYELDTHVVLPVQIMEEQVRTFLQDILAYEPFTRPDKLVQYKLMWS